MCLTSACSSAAALMAATMVPSTTRPPINTPPPHPGIVGARGSQQDQKPNQTKPTTARRRGALGNLCIDARSSAATRATTTYRFRSQVRSQLTWSGQRPAGAQLEPGGTYARGSRQRHSNRHPSIHPASRALAHSLGEVVCALIQPRPSLQARAAARRPRGTKPQPTGAPTRTRHHLATTQRRAGAASQAARAGRAAGQAAARTAHRLPTCSSPARRAPTPSRKSRHLPLLRSRGRLRCSHSEGACRWRPPGVSEVCAGVCPGTTTPSCINKLRERTEAAPRRPPPAAAAAAHAGPQPWKHQRRATHPAPVATTFSFQRKPFHIARAVLAGWLAKCSRQGG
jgi:hypothetical protein